MLDEVADPLVEAAGEGAEVERAGGTGEIEREDEVESRVRTGTEESETGVGGGGCRREEGGRSAWCSMAGGRCSERREEQGGEGSLENGETDLDSLRSLQDDLETGC